MSESEDWGGFVGLVVSVGLFFGLTFVFVNIMSFFRDFPVLVGIFFIIYFITLILAMVLGSKIEDKIVFEG